jgi:hypothetical protein
MPRAALLDAALAALFERAKPVTSGENADLGDFERLFESYVELLKDVAHDPALSGARERLLGEIRRQLETHPFDPEDRHSAPIGWGRNMAELAEILGRGALGPLASPGP